MLIENYINDIFNNPIYIFDQIIKKVIGENIKQAQRELKRHSTDVDVILFKAIKSVLKDISTEEGVISSFIYRKFGIELQKNKKREQLVYLGSQLKAQYNKVKSERSRLYKQKERISSCLADLNRIADSFNGKKYSFGDEQTYLKRKYCIKEIDEKIETLKEYELLLESKYNNFGDTEKVYRALLKKIPRYYKLQDNSNLA